MEKKIKEKRGRRETKDKRQQCKETREKRKAKGK